MCKVAKLGRLHSLLFLLTTNVFYGSCRAFDPMCTCLCILTITLELNDLWPTCWTWCWFVLTLSRSSSQVKVMGQSSWSQEETRTQQLLGSVTYWLGWWTVA